MSGIGPLAGSDVLAKVIKNAAIIYGAIEDCEYPDAILLSHGIKGVDNTASLNSNFENEIISMVQKLESQGANIIGIACNTAYAYLDKISTKRVTTLINLIDAVSSEAANSKEKCLLLTSIGSKDQKLYHEYLNKYGASFQETTPSQQSLVDEVIGLIMEHKLSEAGQVMEGVLMRAKEDGIVSVIAGCTELPIAIQNMPSASTLNIIDSNDILAKKLLESYYGDDLKH